MKAVGNLSLLLCLWVFLGRLGDVVPEQDLVTPPTDPAANSQAKPQDNHLEPKLIAPAASIQSGLLLEPPLDLSGFTREQFVALMETTAHVEPYLCVCELGSAGVFVGSKNIDR